MNRPTITVSQSVLYLGFFQRSRSSDCPCLCLCVCVCVCVWVYQQVGIVPALIRDTLSKVWNHNIHNIPPSKIVAWFYPMVEVDAMDQSSFFSACQTAL